VRRHARDGDVDRRDHPAASADPVQEPRLGQWDDQERGAAEQEQADQGLRPKLRQSTERQQDHGHGAHRHRREPADGGLGTRPATALPAMVPR
jgi:hypothetical protein